MNITEKEIGRYRGWDIKCVTNNENGEVFYMAYFDVDAQKIPIMLDSKDLASLKYKIRDSKFTKIYNHKNYENFLHCRLNR